MANLFDLISPGDIVVPHDDWRPESPPSLSAFSEIFVNFETNGLQWWNGNLPVGVGVFAGDRSWYLPFGHQGKGNLDPAVVYRFCQQEFKGKLITNINTRFDTHMARAWGEKMGGGGLDFEAMGCHLSDVGHYVALLDDHRMEMNLDSIISDYLKEVPMKRLDESQGLHRFSAGQVMPRARYQVEIVKRLKDVLWPKLTEQGLQRVRQLEDDVIPVVVEMEKNGSPIDLELLDTWIKQVHEEYCKVLMDLYRDTGLKINPNSNPDQAKLFQHLKLQFIEFTDTGAPSFGDAVIKGIDHPTVKKLRRAKKLASIHSKLSKYRRVIDSKGILRYALHQLRMTKDERDHAGSSGTNTGRFSSTEIAPGVGTNIQQVLKPEKQFLTFGDEYFVRDVHIPASGEWLSVDAEQIQYRIFAHEANSPRINKRYEEDPWTSFHKMVHKMLLPSKPDLSYRLCKDTNFAKMFAAGPSKIALMLGFITKKEYKELRAAKANRNHPKLVKVKEILDVYAREMPEVDAALKKAEEIAKTRGFVRSVMGRRSRFPDQEQLHKALNGRIQMSEADIMKAKAVELHRARKYTDFLLRFQVHDEFDGDAREPHTKARVAEVLNAQSFELRIPILFGVKTGKSWGACAAEELAKLRREAAEAAAANDSAQVPN